MMRLMVFGMGYSATEAVRALQAAAPAGLTVSGTSRTAGPAAAGTRLHVFDGTAPTEGPAADLSAATHLLVSIAPDADGDPVLRHYGAAIAAAPNLQWIGYFSTVGVYGDHGGRWIDEAAACLPANARSRQRLVAEQGWRTLCEARALPLAILRLAGIYGPGRSAFDKLAAGTARRIVKPGQVFNRIHVADIGRITARAAQRRLAGTYNVADDLPAPPQDVIACAAAIMGAPPPPETAFEDAAMTPMARSFYADNKRVANGAIKRTLGLPLLFPDYRQGLAAIWRTNA